MPGRTNLTVPRWLTTGGGSAQRSQSFARALVGGASAFLLVSALFLGAVIAANPAANLDQCANYNGPVASPATNCSSADLPAGSNNWVNGNLGSSKARYFEGNSVPYRMRLTNLTTGAGNVHHLIIEWDTTKGGKHSFDYLTDFDRTVGGADPCLGVVPACGPAQAYGPANLIPLDSQVSGAGVTQIAGHFKIYGGSITSVSAITFPNGSGFAGDKSARLTINFTASQANPVIAWGGHIATRQDWGAALSAVAISGSPYHMRLIDLDLAGGNQDRSLSADAVIFPASITIIKDAVPDDAQDFAFAADGGLATPFSLDDDADGTLQNTKLFNISTDFKAYHFTETTVSGWALSFANPPCTVTSANGGSSSGNAGTGVLTVNLKEGENYTCTFTNTRANASLTVIKHVVNDNGGDAVAGDWTMDITGGSPSANNFAGSESPGQTVTITPNTPYSVGESGGPSGYTSDGGSAGCASLTGIAPGGSATCTITNNDQAASLTVIKHVVNDNGGDADASDWTMNITGGGTPSANNFAGSESPGQTVTIDANTAYSVGESGGPFGYTGDGGSTDCASLTGIAPGGSATCTIVNDDQAASLTVIKHVVNDNGGDAVAGDWTMDITGGNPDSNNFAGAESPGTTVSIDANAAYSVDESGGPSGYSGDGGDAGCASLTGIAPGGSATCTITNDDSPADVSFATDVDAQIRDNVTITGRGTPSGTVDFYLYGDSKCEGAVVDSDLNVGLVGGSATSKWIDISSSGTYFWQEHYDGDANNKASTGPCEEEIDITSGAFDPPAAAIAALFGMGIPLLIWSLIARMKPEEV